MVRLKIWGVSINNIGYVDDAALALELDNNNISTALYEDSKLNEFSMALVHDNQIQF